MNGKDTELTSLPLWERGLKYGIYIPSECRADVAPLVGAWIEINEIMKIISEEKVAPLVGAWIEIRNMYDIHDIHESLPLWERGLKLIAKRIKHTLKSRSPCGSVD